MYGWLQRDRRYEPQAIEISNGGLAEVDELDLNNWRLPLWIKITLRRYDANDTEIAVQAFGNDRFTGEIFYGHDFVDTKTVEGEGDGPAEIDLVLDTKTQPVAPPATPWPDPESSYVIFRLSFNADVPDAYLEEKVYYLEWGFDMLSDFVELLKRSISLCAWSETIDAGYSAPNDVVVLVDESLDRFEVKARLANALVVVHSPIERRPDEDRSGGFGRKGREFVASVTVYARDVRGLDPKKEYAVDYLGVLLADLEELLNPTATVNTLSGYLYDSDYELEDEAYDASDEAGPSVVAARGVFTGWKIFYTEGVPEEIPAGEGVAFNFNQNFIEGPSGKKQNDHAVFYVSATDTWHQIGITCDTAKTGSKFFYHRTSSDLRTWTDLDDLEIGTGATGDPKNVVFAPHIIENPNYGVGGAPFTNYKYLMFYAGVTHDAAHAQCKEKIFVDGTSNDALTGWTPLNGGDPIYWSGMETTGYPLGAPWCPKAIYDADWCGSSRDPFVFFDDSDWWIAITAKNGSDSRKQVVGLGKFSGGTTPDFADVEHNDVAVWSPDYIGLDAESSTVQKINGRWYLTSIGLGGTRLQSSTSHPSTAPFNNSHSAGVLINDTGPQTVLANEIVQLSGLTYICSGHKNQGSFYSYTKNELDFSDLNEDDDGLYPTENPLHSIAGLRGLREGSLDETLRWTVEDDEGASGAFYRQPVWGDQADSCGYGASGMTGNSYIATLFQHWHPGAGLDGDEYADSSRVGWIKSSTFTITRDRISLMVAGADDEDNEFVGLFCAADDRLLFRETGTGDHTLTLREWDTTDIIGMEVYLAIVDQGTANGDCIDVDAITEYNSSGRGDSGVPSTPEINGSKLESLLTI